MMIKVNSDGVCEHNGDKYYLHKNSIDDIKT